MSKPAIKIQPYVKVWHLFGEGAPESKFAKALTVSAGEGVNDLLMLGPLFVGR